MKTLLFIVMFLFVNLSFAQENRVPFDPARDSEKDLKAALKVAQKENKRVLLDIGGEWCPWCKLMDKFIEENSEVKETLEKNYVVVKVNYSKENKNEKFLSKYPKVSGYPHIFILDKKGKLVHSQNTGELEEGKGYNKDKYLEFLNKYKAKK